MGIAASLWQDVRVASRVLWKNRGATALSVISLAAGIGLTAAVFSVGDALLLRPFPLQRPGEVMKAASRGEDGQWLLYGWAEYEDLRSAAAGVAELAAYQRRGALLAGEPEPEMALTHVVTPNYFSLLGVRAAVGRASVEEIEGRPAAVLGYRLWQRRFGGDPEIVGKMVLVNQKAFVVSGVMPAEFTGLQLGVLTDVWMSVEAWFEVLGRRQERQARSGQFEVIARLKPGVSAWRAAAQFDAAIRGEGKRKAAPAGAPGTILEARFAPGWRRSLVMGGGLLLALGLVLFVACANVAQLRLAQAESRKRELGVRMALGAGGWRITRHLVAEAALVGGAGAGLGLLAAQWLMNAGAELVAGGRAYVDYGMRLDHRVLLFTLGAAAFCVLAAGLAPARHAARLDVAEVLKSEQGTTGARRRRQSTALIACQVAVSMALFGTMVAFLQSLWNARAVRPGLDPAKKLFAMTVSPGLKLPPAQWCELASERMAGLPGVRGATFARRLPLSGSGGGATVPVELPDQARLGVRFNNVAGNYFALMGTRVVAGRGIEESDREGSPPVVVVSQRLAAQLFGNRNPLGEWITVAGRKRQVAGVAEDAPSNSVHEDPEPYLYLPLAQSPSGEVTLIAETVGEPGALAAALRRELRQFDPGVTIFWSTTLAQHMRQALAWDRMMAWLAGGLGLFGVLLTAAGLFGVVQYAVSRRRREFGLRLALGARPGEIRRMVLGESLRMAAWGIPAGLALLGAMARLVRSMVLGVTPLDPALYLWSAAAAVAIAVGAAWLPARRATQVDPMAALRQE